MSRQKTLSMLPSIVISGLVFFPAIAVAAQLPAARPQARCMRTVYGPTGMVVIPAGAEAIEQEDVDLITGDVDVLYPGIDTSTEEWYAGQTAGSDGCDATIGGFIPDTPVDTSIEGVENPDGVVQALADYQSAIAAKIPTNIALLPSILAPGVTYKPPLCHGVPTCQPPAGSPLDGDDIIFVRGFRNEPIEDLLNGKTLPSWPADKAAFYDSGQWKDIADDYWQDHIQKFLKTERQAKNRYLTIAWSDHQRLEFAAHAMLTQIADAMIDGKGVVLLNPGDKREMKGFCHPRCVIISHSTGSVITDVAMWYANTNAWGQTKFIPEHVRVHVAFGGAISGTNWATVVLGAAVAPATAKLCPIANAYLHRPLGTPCNFSVLFQTILADLQPSVAQGKWGSRITNQPVPVLTVAGGSHEAFFPYKHFFVRGMDDGVVPMDSACGTRTSSGVWPAGFTPGPMQIGDPRLFDLGMHKVDMLRAMMFYREQIRHTPLSTNPVPRAASACTPFKTSWGMLQPVQKMVVAQLFYPRHYPLIQTAENHGQIDPTDDMIGGASPKFEDVRAIRNHDVYTLNLVKPGIATAQIERVKGRRVRFNLFGSPRYIWIWRRTYHLMKNWENSEAADYVYDFVR